MAAPISLLATFHPSMELPFQWDSQAFPFEVSPAARIYNLIDDVERMFEQVSNQMGPMLMLQINVLWNVKEANKALNPSDAVGLHFTNGETFAVYGEVRPMQAAKAALPEEEKMPVTILTGFLGAGKTTLLNYILQEQREQKIAVIENEFGEVSIDDALLKEKNVGKLALAEQVVVMDNGCMCCTIRGDLVNGLKQILEAKRKGSHIDAILIETTGMADPVPIVRTFMASPEMTAELRLDGVICVADARNLPQRLDDQVEEGKVNEAYQQVAFSDKILLNKIDLVTTEEAISIKDRIREINAFAKVLPSVRGRVQLSELSNMRAHDMVHFADVAIEREAETAPELQPGHGEGHGHGGGHGHGDGHGHQGEGHGDGADCKEEHGHGGGSHGPGHGAGEGHGHGHAAKRSRHDSRVNSFAIVREGEIEPEKLGKWMQMLGQLPPEKGQVFRIKAILAVRGHPLKHVFHAVMDVSDEDDAGPWGEDEKRVCKIVFIGKSLDQPFLRASFERIFVQ